MPRERHVNGRNMRSRPWLLIAIILYYLATVYLEVVYEGGVGGRDGEVELLVADLKVDVGEAQVRLPNLKSKRPRKC